MKRLAQRGAAILIAMLTVALIATFAAASLWQQWRGVEVETAERARVQSGWILTGALDWARLLLREDHMGAGATGADHLGEPWAVPLQEARLSSFLAADKSSTVSDLGPEVMDAFLSGQIIDLQSMLNLNNLIDANGQPREAQVDAFSRLFDILGLPQSELEKLTENMRFAVAAQRVTPSPPQAPLMPQRVPELAWLGLTPSTIAALEPYVTFLPPLPTPVVTTVNANTAPAEVIAAAGGIDLADAQRLVQVRASSYFRLPADIVAQLGGAAPEQANALGTTSDYFEVRARLRLDKLVVEERSVVHRQGINVRVVSRERGAPDPTAMSRIALTQR
jgi:general secretion pathway protein K